MSDAPMPLAGLSAVKLTLMAKQVRAQATHVLRADPIAIVGMACRVPGGGDTPDQFWQLLANGTDAVREVPADRWNGEAWYDKDLSATGKTATKWGAFLDRIDGFDAEYFGILPREAQRMDPQQRLFLEVAIEALDDAGLTREQLAGSRASVFIASYHNDYAQLQHNDIEAIDPRTLTGTLHSVLANRLSYFLDLRGPSVSIDTACSSSLVATHLACQSLRFGESDVAIAGGVSLMITPELLVSMSKVGFMSPDGRCKTFDELADGFGRGEGCGIVVLKRLADAIADGDRVLAVIRSSAVNQDGHSTLLAAPSGPAQQALIREALATAQLEPGRIGLMETHGTGTALGDPIEVEAIAATIGQSAPGATMCLLGAAKANVGHLEAAAGVTGLIKVVLALRHEAVPPQVHFQRLSPHISLEGTRLSVPTRLTRWPRGDVPRCAAVSSFGVGGTNAHVIVEEAPTLPAASGDVPLDASRVLTLSAHSAPALHALATAWSNFLVDTPDSVADICYTAALRRTHHDHRLAVVGRTKEDFAARIAEHLREEGAVRVAAERRSAVTRPRVGFVFSGQGPQWHAMGRELLASDAVFRSVIEQCDRLLQPLSGWSLLDELGAAQERSRMDQTEVAQPALFALQVALAAQWRSWGIVPDAVVGHSVGEIAALHVAGVLTLDEAVHVVWHRGRIMQQATGLGSMASVGLTAVEAQALVQPFGERLSVAAINSPRSVVLSGDSDALQQALSDLATRGIGHRLLPVRYAFHSSQMTPFQERLCAELANVRTASATLDVYSSVTGGPARDVRFNADYFGRNVREPVRFADAIEAMANDGVDVFLEIGPHPVLGASIGECLAASATDAQGAASVLASLRRGRPERETMLLACAGLYEAGCMPAWDEVQDDVGDVVSLPGTPWQRKRHWIRQRPTRLEASGASQTGHPLLGRRVSAAGIRAHVFEGASAAAHAWLADHRIFGTLVMPAAAVLEAFAAAGRIAANVQAVRLTSFAMERPLMLPEEGEPSARWQTVVTATDAGGLRMELFEAAGQANADESAWRRVASALAEPSTGDPRPSVRSGAVAPVAAEAICARFAELGVAFGPAFRCLRDVARGERVATAWVELPELLVSEAEKHLIHPVLLDAALQLCSVAAVPAHDPQAPHQVLLPLGADRVEIRPAASPRLLARVSIDETTERSLVANFTLETPAGECVASFEGMRFAVAEPGVFARPDAPDPWLYEVAWHPVPMPSHKDSARADGWWLILADSLGVGEALADVLSSAGGRCLRVIAGDSMSRPTPERWIVDPALPEHFRRLLEESPWREGQSLRGVVHLWGIDATPVGSRSPEAGDRMGIGSLLHLAQALASSRWSAPLWLVSRGAHVVAGDEPANALDPRAAGAWGLGGVIAAEHPELQLRRIDLDPTDSADRCATRIAQSIRSDAPSRDIALRGEQVFAPRLQPYRTSRARTPQPQRLDVVRAGTLDGIALRPLQRLPLAPHEVRLRVLAAGLNFRDVLLALGMYPGGGIPLGAECVGVVSEVGSEVVGMDLGDTVFGYVPASLASEAAVPAAFLAKLPQWLGIDEAAGLPIAFLTAYYGLHRLARLERGERVLIHAAAGGVGLAAVQLALRRGAVVFATAGSEEKRELLRGLGVTQVMDSRTLDFAEQILAATLGEGVHVVLNSLAGDFIASSLRALGANGRFLELGKRDILTPEGLASIRPDVSYHAFDLGTEAQANHGLLRPMFDELLAALEDGSLRPLPVKTFAIDDARDAFRFMAQARHVGKIVLRLPESGGAAQAIVSPDATYWITGGLGALGLETARWLVDRGARHLVLSGRRAPTAAAVQALASLQSRGAAVRVVQADAGDRERMQSVLADIVRDMPALRGVIHAAGTVRDAVLVHQPWSDAQAVLRGKAHGAWVLHELTRDMPLDFFVMYSAAGVLLGARGQGVYPAANAQLDALAGLRRRLGLPALSVAWGAWKGAGMAAKLAAQGHDQWAERGLRKIEAAEGFARLETLMRDGATCAAVLPIDWGRFLARLPDGVDREFFRAVAPRSMEAQAASGATQDITFATRLQSLPAGQRRDALTQHLTERALHVLGLDASTTVDVRAPLKDIGLDSLMAVELRNALTRSIGQVLPATLLFDYPTLEALTRHLVRILQLETDDMPQPNDSATTGAAAQAKTDLAALSDAEAEVLLLAELNGAATEETP
jgi:acyl transferase domain-containing protein/NAD(P)-dependent dehydrogenase (short-subunit alcohol dehydrogenase family)/acyl carrier protein